MQIRSAKSLFFQIGLADSLFSQALPYGNMNMVMNPFNAGYAGYPNPANYLSSLSAMSYPSYSPNIEKDYLRIQQMYAASPYTNLLASTASAARGGLTQAEMNALSNYPASLFGPSGSSLYNSSGVMPTATSASPFPSISSANIYSSAATSPNYGNPTTSTAARSAASLQQQQQNMMASLTNYLPSFSNLKAAQGGAAALASAGSSSSTGKQPSRFELDNWQYMNSTASMFQNSLAGISSLTGVGNKTSTEQTTTTSLASAAPQQPGPNAMKNPLLSKELSMPSSGPVISSSPIAIPSIPTSVITKTSNLSATTGGPTASNSNVSSRVSLGANRSSPNSSSLYRNITAHSATTHRNSPTVIANANNTISITGTSSRNSPEPHLIVKNVNDINMSLKKAASSSAVASVASSSNMGIVYPKKADPKKFDLSQNTDFLKAAQSQLNSLTASTTKSYTTVSSSIGRSPQSSIVSQQSPLRQGQQRNINDKYRIVSNSPTNRNANTPVTTTIQGANNSTTTFIRRPPVDATSKISIPTSEVTITPTGKKLVTNSLTIRPVSHSSTSPVTNAKQPMATYSLVNKNNSTSPSTQRPSINKKFIPPQMLKQQPQKFVAKKQNISNTTISVAPTSNVTQIGSSTLTRQNTSPILTGNINSVRGRMVGNAVTANLESVNGTKIIQRSVPTLVRQNTVPALKSFSAGSSSAGSSRVTARTVGSTNSTTIGNTLPATSKIVPTSRIQNQISNRGANQTSGTATALSNVNQSSVLRTTPQKVISAGVGRATPQHTAGSLQQTQRNPIRAISTSQSSGSNANRIHNSPPALVTRTPATTMPSTLAARMSQPPNLLRQQLQQKVNQKKV